MSPMSMNTFDAKTLQQMAHYDAQDSTQGERTERWFTQLAMAVIGIALVTVLVL